MSRSPRGSLCDSCKLRFHRPLWFVWWSDVCFEVLILSRFFHHPSIDSTKKIPLHLFGCFASIIQASIAHQEDRLSNIPWMAPDRMAFVKNYTKKQIKLKWTAAPFNNFFKYWRENKTCLSLSNDNECLQKQQQQQLYLYSAVPYIDLHDTKKLDKNIERVQAALNNLGSSPRSTTVIYKVGRWP